MLNCEGLSNIERDCANAPGSIYPIIYINDSSEVDWENKVVAEGEITTLALSATPTVFNTIEFRKNIATYSEEGDFSDPNAPVIFEQTLTLPIHGRDAAKSNKISIMAAGQRELDIIVRQKDSGKYVYLRNAVLSNVGEGIGATKKDGSKYNLTFTSESEQMAYYIEESQLTGLL